MALQEKGKETVSFKPCTLSCFLFHLLGHDLDGELAILLDLILQRHDQASYELLSVVELDELVSDGRGANHFVELYEGLAAQVSVL